MAVTFAKRALNNAGDENGRGITVAATATLGTTIHDPYTTSTAAGDYDEVWLWATNIDAVPIKLTIEFGGVTVAADIIEVTIPPESGLVQIIPGLLLSGNNNLTAFAGTASKINLFGFVNLITEA